MRAWMLVMTISCLSNGNVKGCSVGKSVTVSKRSKAVISCPSIMANSSELMYLLRFNDSNISQIHLNKQLDPPESLFCGQFEVTAYNSGVYICILKGIYPPPLREVCHSTEVIVAETQFLLQINDTVPVANQSCQVSSPLIPDVVMWAGSGVLLVYSLSVTCITVILWRKLKRDEDDTNLYMNTRPAELRKPTKV